MEEQLRMLRMQDELERQRQTRERERKLISLDVNKPPAAKQAAPQKPPITVRSETIEPNVYTFRSYDERKAHSEGSKENFETIKQNDKQIYRFFTNSARDTNNFRNLKYNNNYCDFEELSNDDDIMPNSMSSSYNTYPSKTVRSNQDKEYRQCQHNSNMQNQGPCNFCKENQLVDRVQQENIAAYDSNRYICSECRNEPICLNCRKEICIRCKKPTKLRQEAASKPAQPNTRNDDDIKFFSRQPILHAARADGNETRPRVRQDSFRLMDADDNDSFTEQYSMLKNPYHKPYSFNVEETSIFHPKSKMTAGHKLSVNVKNGEISINQDSFDELKRITDEKLSKYAKNYGELRTKTTDSTSIPLKQSKNLSNFVRELDDSDNSDAFKRLQSKWQVRNLYTSLNNSKELICNFYSFCIGSC